MLNKSKTFCSILFLQNSRASWPAKSWLLGARRDPALRAREGEGGFRAEASAAPPFALVEGRCVRYSEAEDGEERRRRGGAAQPSLGAPPWLRARQGPRRSNEAASVGRLPCRGERLGGSRLGQSCRGCAARAWALLRSRGRRSCLGLSPRVSPLLWARGGENRRRGIAVVILVSTDVHLRSQMGVFRGGLFEVNPWMSEYLCQ